jgi:hypothetical protein
MVDGKQSCKINYVLDFDEVLRSFKWLETRVQWNFSSPGESFGSNKTLQVRQNASLTLSSPSPHITYCFVINETLQIKSPRCSLLRTCSHLYMNMDCCTEGRTAVGLSAYSSANWSQFVHFGVWSCKLTSCHILSIRSQSWYLNLGEDRFHPGYFQSVIYTYALQWLKYVVDKSSMNNHKPKQQRRYPRIMQTIMRLFARDVPARNVWNLFLCFK